MFSKANVDDDDDADKGIIKINLRYPITIIWRLFFELDYRQRLDIFFKLAKKRSNISSLSKDLDLPMPEIHRNVIRLQNAKLIKKDTEGLLCISSFGKSIIKLISTFNFLTNSQEFFNKHDFGDLPDRFV
jgi:predicted transcriptional regulator